MSSLLTRLAQAFSAPTFPLTCDDVPQSKPLPGQVANSAGGHSYQASDEERLARFLVLGTEGGTFYAKERDLNIENVEVLQRMLADGKGPQVVQTVRDMSVAGRTCKQDTLIFSLAYCAHRAEDEEVRRAALAVLSEVCRTPTMLFGFLAASEKLSRGSRTGGTGWGRAQRRAVSQWYTGRSPQKLAYTVTKYRERLGWKHRDVLRLAHPKALTNGHELVFRYCVKGASAVGENDLVTRLHMDMAEDEQSSQVAAEGVRTVVFLRAVEELRGLEQAGSAEIVAEEVIEQACGLIKGHHLAWEHVPSPLLRQPEVWCALLENMPMTALMRNLGRLSSNGVLDRADQLERVCAQLRDANRLIQARVHPMSVLVALRTYERGRGVKGSLTWTVHPEVSAALDAAFYLAFGAIKSTGKRHLLALDVSGSMCAPCAGSNVLSCREASAAMAMVALRTEPLCKTMAFTDTLVPLALDASMSLAQVLAKTSRMPFGSTDCAQPMLYALEHRLAIDTFVVYTDSETWAGKVHPTVALQRYRSRMNLPDARLIVVGMCSNGFTIADPDDRGMLDVVGFDTATPEVMRAFTAGEL